MFASRSRADRLEEIAAALDAGLPPAAALAAGGVEDPTPGPIAAALGRAWHLPPFELALLSACEEAGRLPPALRRMAAGHAARTDQHRELWIRLAYPCAVLALAIFVNAVVVPGGGTTATMLATLLGVGAAATTLTALRLRKATTNGDVDPLAWPMVGAHLRHRCDAPYLDAMAALHGAGVPIGRAHSIATAAVPFAAARVRHVVAGQAIERGEPLAHSLAAARALGSAPLSMVAKAENIGNLESAFERGSEYERGVAHRSAMRFVRFLGGSIYLVAVLAVAWTALSFYGRLLGR
ncbi:MAG: type II secretion system F family protein [Planctomycetota bacterium]